MLRTGQHLELCARRPLTAEQMLAVEEQIQMSVWRFEVLSIAAP